MSARIKQAEGLFLHDNTAETISSTKLLYDLTTLCLNRTLPCGDFMDVTMGAIPSEAINVARSTRLIFVMLKKIAVFFLLNCWLKVKLLMGNINLTFPMCCHMSCKPSCQK